MNHVDAKAKEIALRELEKVRQFIESGEVMFVVVYGKKDGQNFHFGGTTSEHRSPESLMRLAEVFAGLALDLLDLRAGAQAKSSEQQRAQAESEAYQQSLSDRWWGRGEMGG